MSKPKKSKFAAHRHFWKYKLRNGRVVRKPAKVVYAKIPVELDLRVDHVRKSIRLKGVGDTQTCSMAVCTLAQADRFPHPVTGDVEWYYSRCFIGSKVDADGFVTECYVYSHSDDVAKFQDTRNGQAKLLAELFAHGDRKVRVRPLARTERGTHRSGAMHRGSKDDGSRVERFKGYGSRGAGARQAHVMASA